MPICYKCYIWLITGLSHLADRPIHSFLTGYSKILVVVICYVWPYTIICCVGLEGVWSHWNFYILFIILFDVCNHNCQRDCLLVCMLLTITLWYNIIAILHVCILLWIACQLRSIFESVWHLQALGLFLTNSNAQWQSRYT